MSTARWKSTQLGEISLCRMGKTILAKELCGEGVAVYSAGRENKPWGYIGNSDLVFQRGTIVLSARGNIGYPRLPVEQQFVSTQTTIALVLHDVALAPFVRYALECVDWSQLTSQTTIPMVTVRQVEALEILVPPLPEQLRIVEAIESYLTRLDDAIATLERVQQNLKRYRASVLKAAVEGQPVPTEAELARKEGRDYEPANVLLERILEERRRRWIDDAAEKGRAKAEEKARKSGRRWTSKDDTKTLEQECTKAAKKYQEPEPPDTSNLPDLPEGWCWATVEQLTSGDRAAAYGVLVPGPDVPNGVILVRVGDINDGQVAIEGLKRIEPTIADQFVRTYLQGGEVLMTLVGTIGRTAVAPERLKGANVARAVGVVPVSPQLDPRWVEIWFRSPAQRQSMISKAHEVARKTLNLEDVRSAIVAVPPRSEQTRIVSAIEDIQTVAAASSRAVMLSVIRCQRLRQSILKWAFEGKLVPQDPNDEPASVVLERIKAERANRAAEKNGKRRGGSARRAR